MDIANGSIFFIMQFCPFRDNCAAVKTELPDPEERIWLPEIMKPVQEMTVKKEYRNEEIAIKMNWRKRTC